MGQELLVSVRNILIPGYETGAYIYQSQLFGDDEEGEDELDAAEKAGENGKIC